jgi:hypothetical protein
MTVNIDDLLQEWKDMDEETKNSADRIVALFE